MKRRFFTVAVAGLSCCLHNVSLMQAQEAVAQPLTVAVLSFDGADEKLQTKGTEVATLLGAQLSTNASLWCVERTEVEKILSEHTLKLTGLTDPATAVQAGKIIGARVLVTGRIIASGEGALLVAKVMSTETSRVFGETASAPSLASLDKATAELAEKIGKLLEKQRPVFQIEVEKPEARIARLRKLLDGKALPSIMVSIPEQHLRQSVPDPAAETELNKTLLALGFDVIDWGGAIFHWGGPDSAPGMTIWSLFDMGTDKMDPSPAPFMLNLRVADLDALFAALRTEGCNVLGDSESSEFGKFGWVIDPEGHKVELWEPPSGQ